MKVFLLHPARDFTVKPELRDAIFDGVKSSHIGTQGRLMGGAAGHEIDCVLPANDGQPGVTVLARSSGHAPTMRPVSALVADGIEPDALEIHADLVLYARPRGGEVFSVGSICWCGSLAVPGGEVGVARVTENVLRRFAGLARR